MVRKPRLKTQCKFDLYDDSAQEQRLRVYLKALAEAGKAREWIVTALLAALPKEAHEH